MANILIIGALPRSLLNFRGELIKKMISDGHSVTAMSAPASEEEVKKIIEEQFGKLNICDEVIGYGPGHYYTVDGFVGKSEYNVVYKLINWVDLLYLLKYTV